MSYFHDAGNARDYARECEHCDATQQLVLLHKVLPERASILELGSGPGNDLELLSRHYEVTGSDESPAFLNMLKERHPGLSILELDAAKLKIDARYDAIYSNKVLQHLTDQQLAQSFERQAALLHPGGYVLHLIWCDLDEAPTDVFPCFLTRDEGQVKALMGSAFKVVEVAFYSEFKSDDSLAILARKV